MKTNSQIFILLFGAILGMVGCQSGSGGNSGPQPDANQHKPVGTTSSKACYQSDLCFTAISATQIVDTNHDYLYADPAGFPTPSLRGQYIAPSRFIDLNYVDGSAAIADSFIVKDFMDVTHGRYALISPEVVAIMQQIREALGRAVYITSGYRSPGHNSSTDGSAQWSRHMYGDGVDFSSAQPNYPELQTLCKKFDASFTLIYATHIHCDWRLHELDPAFYYTDIVTPKALGEIAPEAQLIFEATSTNLNVKVRIAEGDSDDVNEGELIYQWYAQDAQGHALSSSASTLELPIAGAPYTIDVLVGGSIHLHQNWPQ